jgi:hypothetical protein
MVEQPKIPNLDGLTELANRDGVDIKPTLLRVMTDLYVQKPVHSLEEEIHYTELAARLIDQVDAATRSIVADRLANYPAAPQAVVERLAHGRIQRGEAEPVLILPAETDIQIAGPSAQASLAELSELFLTADAQERRMILLHLDYAMLPLAAPVDPKAAQDANRRLEMMALSHNSEGFAQEIGRALDIEHDLARRLIDDDSGEPILVLALAFGMPADVLQRILLCLNPAISQSASRLVAIWQAWCKPAQRPQRPAAHQPHLYDDGKAQPAIPARPAIRWEEHSERRER